MQEDVWWNHSAPDSLYDLARERMEELARAGYSEARPDYGAMTCGESGSKFATRQPSVRGRAYPVRSEKMQQTYWLSFGGPDELDERGYTVVEVCDAHSRTDAAIIAALVALEGRPMDATRLHEALMSFVARDEAGGVGGVVDEDGRLKIPPRHRAGERLPEELRDPNQRRSLMLVLLLLRHHRPGFGRMPAANKATLLAEDAQVHSSPSYRVRELRYFAGILWDLPWRSVHYVRARIGPVAVRLQ